MSLLLTTKEMIDYFRDYLIYSHSAATPFLSAAFGQGDGPIALGDVVCSGTEDQVRNCSHEYVHNCISHSNDVGVRCVTSTTGSLL